MSALTCSKMTMARVAVGIGTVAEVAWLAEHRTHCEACAAKLSEMERTMSLSSDSTCLSPEAMLRTALIGTVSDDEEEHLSVCRRCSMIGFLIANLPARHDDAARRVA